MDEDVDEDVDVDVDDGGGGDRGDGTADGGGRMSLELSDAGRRYGVDFDAGKQQCVHSSRDDDGVPGALAGTYVPAGPDALFLEIDSVPFFCRRRCCYYYFGLAAFFEVFVGNRFDFFVIFFLCTKNPLVDPIFWI